MPRRVLLLRMLSRNISLMPQSGNLLAWSAGWANRWTFPGNDKTSTAITTLRPRLSASRSSRTQSMTCFVQ
ncbi:hypothetical protein BU25DRAFT_414491 [Macroventuria anomochaeta]|uniref:Uncharacterized protein n=1 Tax=Macroventuria anomochaeta TaxID=301207 RepID=A0ACB6RMP2_9PLEO|nr:uncharacterized protein BU25DRAFT_414491 [Macroventuria anomochaeta]KAF2623225.1 hypothetical protein BU25DRAFT_414491 [Macroventuria anomochaeta]